MCVCTTHQLHPKPKSQTPNPNGQIIIVNKIYYSYLHVKSGAVCPQAQMVTYRQSPAGITYYYAMRQVLEDGVSTTPLNITLKF